MLVTTDLVRSCKMENMTIHTDPYGEVHVIIDRGNGEFTSMSKAFYDEQIKAQVSEAKTK